MRFGPAANDPTNISPSSRRFNGPAWVVKVRGTQPLFVPTWEFNHGLFGHCARLLLPPADPYPPIGGLEPGLGRLPMYPLQEPGGQIRLVLIQITLPDRGGGPTKNGVFFVPDLER